MVAGGAFGGPASKEPKQSNMPLRQRLNSMARDHASQASVRRCRLRRPVRIVDVGPEVHHAVRRGPGADIREIDGHRLGQLDVDLLAGLLQVRLVSGK